MSLVKIVQALHLIPPAWYYTLLFVGFTAEGTSFPLLHVPAMVMFLATAYLVAAGRISLVAAILVATAGSVTGGFITYRLGLRMAARNGRGGAGRAKRGEAADGNGGSAVTGAGAAAPGHRFWTAPERVERVRDLVTRYGAFLALAARWLGVFRPAALLGTGMAGVNPYKVVLALTLGSLVYCTFYQLAAMGLEALSLRLLGQVNLEIILASAIGLALAWLGGFYLLRRVRF